MGDISEAFYDHLRMHLPSHILAAADCPDIGDDDTFVVMGAPAPFDIPDLQKYLDWGQQIIRGEAIPLHRFVSLKFLGVPSITTQRLSGDRLQFTLNPAPEISIGLGIIKTGVRISGGVMGPDSLNLNLGGAPDFVFKP